MPKTSSNNWRKTAIQKLQRQVQKRHKLTKVFDCLLCAQEQTVRCILDYDHFVGSLHCEKCQVRFSCPINAISHDVDVYHAWLDSLEDENSGSASSNPKPV
ncbi:transcription elongation factor Elf1 like-domain-containing protein [Mortierella sp. GBAus27b]|nr:transcription elongation factor Elf1 like-domain-containing protein [Mortierella sp. GBAus27b]